MVRSVASLILLLFLTGCETALVFVGSVHTKGESQSRDVAASLGFSLMRSGFRSDILPEAQIPKEAIRVGAWWNPERTVFVEAIAKEEVVSLRIVPQRGANDASQRVADQIREILAAQFPTLPIQIEAKPEADIFR